MVVTEGTSICVWGKALGVALKRGKGWSLCSHSACTAWSVWVLVDGPWSQIRVPTKEVRSVLSSFDMQQTLCLFLL